MTDKTARTGRPESAGRARTAGNGMSRTICWTCRQGPRSGCSWFAEHRPVPGWTAWRNDIPAYRYDMERRENVVCALEESYQVTACPLYQPSPPRKKPGRKTGTL